MTTAHTTPTSLEEYSRCSDKSWLTGVDLIAQAKQDHADQSTAESVNRALWNSSVLRSTDYHQIDVDVIDGVVYLNGHVNSTGNQGSAEEAARKTPGVKRVKSNLVSDDKIKRDVAGSLAQIEHTYGVKLFTGAANGVIVLSGEVGSIDVRLLAERCAADVPGVRGVINDLRLPDVELQAEDQRFLQPPIGEQIYFTDGLSAIIQKVIINPDNRRVVSMVVRGKHSSSQQDSRLLSYNLAQAPETDTVIPMSAVRYITKNSGFLHITSAEAARYGAFDSTAFTAPPADWTPPYPYCPAEVLFPLETVENMNPADRLAVVVNSELT